MPHGGFDEPRPDPPAPVLGQDEDALNVAGAPRHGAGPRHPRHEREPRHADRSGVGGTSEEGDVGPTVVRPPAVEGDREGVEGLLGPLVRRRVQPQQPSQVHQVVGRCESYLHAASVHAG